MAMPPAHTPLLTRGIKENISQSVLQERGFVFSWYSWKEHVLFCRLKKLLWRASGCRQRDGAHTPAVLELRRRTRGVVKRRFPGPRRRAGRSLQTLWF